MDEFEAKLKSFVGLEEKIGEVEQSRNIASLSLKTGKMITSLKELTNKCAGRDP